MQARESIHGPLLCRCGTVLAAAWFVATIGCSGAVSSDERAPRPQSSGIATAAPRATGPARAGLGRRTAPARKAPFGEPPDPFDPSPESDAGVVEPPGATNL